MRNILVGRSQEQSFYIKEALENNDQKLFFEPLFEVEKVSVQKESLEKATVFIVTSANACWPIIDHDIAKDVKIFAVGKVTAAVLRNAGFINVSYPENNNATALYKLILQQGDKNQNMLYLRGAVISFDMVQKLQHQGFKAQEILCYKTITHQNFSQNLRNFAVNNHFDEVLLFSKNSAKIFHDLCLHHNMLEYFTSSQILCLSDEIAKQVKNLGFSAVKTFAQISYLKQIYE